MIHNARIFVISTAGSKNELARKLMKEKLALCSATYHSGFLFVNDSALEEGERKFAVMKSGRIPEPGRRELDQVGSVSISGKTEEEVLQVVESLGKRAPSARVVVQIDGPGHCCPLCA